MTTIYQDFTKLRSCLPSLRVEELKAIIRQINSYFHVSSRLTGKKDELITRIEAHLQDAISQLKFDNYDHIRADIYRYCRLPYIPTYSRPINSYSQPSNHHSSSTAPPSSSHRANAPVLDLGPAPVAHSNHNHHTHHHHHHHQQQPLAHHHQTKADPVFGSTSTPSMMRSSAYPIKQPTNNNSPYSNHQPFNPKPLPPFSNANPTAFNPRTLPITFEPSPFYRVDSAASMVAICQKAAQNDRKSVPLSLLLSSEQRSKLSPSNSNTSGSQYQLRMFATSESFYQQPGYLPNPHHPPTLPPALIEFPTTIDIKLNSCSFTANLKGIKKQPGTAPPPNLALVPGKNGIGQALDLKDGKPNQIEIAYSNCDKRFYFVIYLVEYYGVYGLMKNLKTIRKRGHEQVLKEIIAGSGDEDVMTSASVITLTDPVVFGRIKIPIRSMRCKHLQCFDAEMFYTMMEQTPTWLCPVCNSKLKNEEITIDELSEGVWSAGRLNTDEETTDLTHEFLLFFWVQPTNANRYFESILKASPASLDSVVVEADGKWHDERYEHGTSTKRPSPHSVMSVGSGGSGSRASGGDPRRNSGHSRVSEAGQKKRKITFLDLSDDALLHDDDDDDDDDEDEDVEDDEDEEEDHGSYRARSFKRHKAFGHSADCVIDLTLDDD